MSSDLTTVTPIPLSNVVRVDMGKLRPISVAEAADGLYDRFVAAMESMLKARHSEMPDLSGHPAYRPYATVLSKDGRVVAEIDNNGFVTTGNAMGAQLGAGLPGSVNGKSGPDLAQARAEFIAGLVGGKIVRADSAMTQTAYDATPKPQVTIDQTALREDPLFTQLQRIQEARTLFLAQQLGQSGTESA